MWFCRALTLEGIFTSSWSKWMASRIAMSASTIQFTWILCHKSGLRQKLGFLNIFSCFHVILQNFGGGDLIKWMEEQMTDSASSCTMKQFWWRNILSNVTHISTWGIRPEDFSAKRNMECSEVASEQVISLHGKGQTSRSSRSVLSRDPQMLFSSLTTYQCILEG